MTGFSRSKGAWQALLRFVASRRTGLAMVLAGIVPAAISQVWFEAGRFIAAGDVAPFIRDGLTAELGSVWNHQLTGAGSASYETTARLVESVLTRTTAVVGLSDFVAQRIFYSLLIAFVGFGGAYLARTFTRRPSAVLVSGLIAAFNPFVMVSLPNPIPLMAIGATTVLTGITLRAARSRRSVIPFALVTVAGSYLSLNPPTLVVVGVAVSGFAAMASLLVGSGGTRRAMMFLLRATPVVLLLNAWWIVPMAVSLFGDSGVIVAAETDVAGWAWSHAGNDLLSVASLKAHWGWSEAQYFPYAARLDSSWWRPLGWALPLLAFLAPLAARQSQRRRALALSAVVFPVILLAKGLHGPLVGINSWLYDNVPGLWLLREPMGKMGIVLVSLYAVLIAITIDGLAARVRRLRSRRLLSFSMAAAGIVMVAAALVYPIPLWTGEVIPDERGTLPAAHVAVPAAWREAAALLDNAAGKILVLPIDPFYQVTTSWGYHGVDTLVSQLVTRPVIELLPGGYYKEQAGFGSMVQAVEDDLAAGRVDSLASLLSRLGVSHIVVRTDLVPGFSGRPFVDPNTIEATLDAADGFSLLASFPVANVYSFDDAGPVVRLASGILAVDEVDGFGEAAAAASPEFVTVPAKSSAATNFTSRRTHGVASFDLAEAGRYLLEWASDRNLVEIDLSEEAGLLRLSVVEDPAIRVNGEPVGAQELAVWKTADEIIGVEFPDTLALDGARVVTRLPVEIIPLLKAGPSMLGSFGPVGDCNAYDDRSSSEAGLELTRIDGILTLRAASHSACAAAPVLRPDSGAEYLISVDHRTLAGNPARICVWQPDVETCAATEEFSLSSEWSTYTAVFTADPESTRLELFVYADGDAADPTVTQYRNLTIQPIVRAEPIVLDGDGVGSEVVSLGSGAVEVSIEAGPSLLSSFGSLGDCNAYDGRTFSQAGLGLTRLEGVISLRATLHSACTSAPVLRSEPGAEYLITLEHRTLSGNPARICVWQPDVQACAATDELSSSVEWTTYSAVFTPDPNSTRLELFVYADGDAADPTVTQYRNLTIQPLVHRGFDLRRDQPPTTVSGSATVLEAREGKYVVEVPASETSRILVLAESFSTGWRLESGGEVEATHFQADGYANGWSIAPGDAVVVVLRFRPGGWASAAIWISSLGLGVIVIMSVIGRIRPFAMRRRREISDRGHSAMAQGGDPWASGSQKTSSGIDPTGVIDGAGTSRTPSVATDV